MIAVGHTKTSQVAPHNLGVRRVVFHEQNGDGFSFNHIWVSKVLFSSLVSGFFGDAGRQGMPSATAGRMPAAARGGVMVDVFIGCWDRFFFQFSRDISGRTPGSSYA